MITTENKSQSFFRIAIKLFVVLFLVFVLLSWIGAPLMAQTTSQLSVTSKDLFDGKYELHKVTKGETLYGVAKTYATNIDVLKLLNPELETKGLQCGAYIKVPKKGSSITPSDPVVSNNNQPVPTSSNTTPTSSNISTAAPTYHTVTAGETLYSIGKKFSCTIAELKQWNNMTTDNVQIGKKIIVGYNGSTTTSTNTENNLAPTTVAPLPKPTSTTSNTNSSKKMSISETGIATFTSTDEKLLLALHPTAPVGTYITVKNPDNGQTVQVKVIGKLPATDENKNVAIKLSAWAATQLGITDSEAQVQLTYTAQQ